MDACEVDEEVNPYICVLDLLNHSEEDNQSFCGSDMDSQPCRISQGFSCAAYQRSYIQLDSCNVQGLNPLQAVYLRHALFDDVFIVGSCDFFATSLQHALDIMSEMGEDLCQIFIACNRCGPPPNDYSFESLELAMEAQE